MTDLVERPKNEAAKHFRDMADAIEHNSDAPFGGAFVVVPPVGAGDPIETLILDNKQDALQFWKLLVEKGRITVEDLERQTRSSTAFGGRR